MTDFSDDEKALMEQAAQALVKRRFALPAMMFLETVGPMNMVSAAMLRMLSPIWCAVLPASRIDQLATLLERREAIPAFISRIDQAEEQRRRDEKAAQQQPPAQNPPHERTRT